MVTLSTVKASNALLRGTKATFTAVFVGGTSGIGKDTIRAMVGTGVRCKVYLVGRPSAKRSTDLFIRDMQSISSAAEIIWTEAEVSLLAEAKSACDEIIARESRLDLLFMTCGYAPFSARVETTEGIEITQSLQYYTRMLFTLRLLPLLCKSDSPKVVSVLAGGKEPASIPLDDLDMKRPGNFGGFTSQGHCAAMNTAALEVLAQQWPAVTFVHSFPGWVKTGNNKRGLKKGTFMSSIVHPLFEPLVNFMSISSEESGQRHLFLSTSEAVGGKGVSWNSAGLLNTLRFAKGGLFLTDHNCEATENKMAVERLRKEAHHAIWDHTKQKLAAYL